MFLVAETNRQSNSFQNMYDMLQAKVDHLAGKIYFIWPYLANLGAPNMVKWGVPEKILQNAVQTRWSLCQ